MSIIPFITDTEALLGTTEAAKAVRLRRHIKSEENDGTSVKLLLNVPFTLQKEPDGHALRDALAGYVATMLSETDGIAVENLMADEKHREQVTVTLTGDAYHCYTTLMHELDKADAFTRDVPLPPR